MGSYYTVLLGRRIVSGGRFSEERRGCCTVHTRASCSIQQPHGAAACSFGVAVGGAALFVPCEVRRALACTLLGKRAGFEPGPMTAAAQGALFFLCTVAFSKRRFIPPDVDESESAISLHRTCPGDLVCIYF
jgi:hypothetical protein